MSLSIVPGFRTSLVIQDDGGLPYTLYVPLVYDCALLTRTITVPAGFKTDLASIPRGLWNILPKSGSYDRAAVIHDALYQWGAVSAMGLLADRVTRAQADSVLLEAMQALGVGAFTRRIIYAGVRLGGWSAWGEHRRNEAYAG